jgi:hypothetical protein
MLVATAPLFAPPDDRASAECALSHLGRVRYLTSASLLALAGPQGLRAELVDDWVKAGLVYRGTITTDLIAGQVQEYVALTTLGAKLLYAATGEAVGGVSNAALRRSSQKRLHDLSVGEVAAAFLALEDDRRIRLLGVEVDDRKIGTSTVLVAPGRAPERVPLVPDALVVLEMKNGPSAILVEVDMGTIAPKRMEHKYAAYLSWQRDHGPERDFAIRALRVVTLTTNEARLTKLQAAALHANHGQRSGFLLFGLLDDVNVCNAEKIFGPVVHQLGAPQAHRVPLFSLERSASNAA